MLEPTPPKKNIWDVPPNPPAGDATNTTTFAAVGNALSQWEWFEGNLAMLYAALVGSGRDDGFAAMRSYGTIVSFQARRNMTEAAADIYFAVAPDESLQRELKFHLDLAGNLAARRNEIAHGIVQPYVSNLDNPQPSSYALFPAYYATRKRRFDPKDLALQLTAATYVYSSREIDKFAAAFASLVEPTLKLTTRIIAQKRRD